MTSPGASAGRGVRIALAAAMTVLSLLVLEAAVRVIGRTDADGTFYVRQRPVPPLHLPVEQLEHAVRQYRSSTVQTLFVDDPALGWKPRAGAANELYAYNVAGLRAHAATDAAPGAVPARLRVAIFGDSFAHGSEVRFEQSWGARLQATLVRPDRDVEVLNFGVPGYGMDQAFLRWSHEGRAYAPDVVVFGLQVENAGRNLNLLRVLYDSADLPFAKPRFIEAGEDLELINVPVPAPEDVVHIVQNLDAWPLVRHERYYDRDRYETRPWRYSRLAGTIEALVAGGRRGQLEGDLPDEQRRLAFRIIDRFAREVQASGARFVVVHFPRRSDLERARSDGRLPNLALLESVARQMPVVRIDGPLLARAGGGDLGPLFSPGGHYSPEGYGILAAAVAERLQTELSPVARRTGTTGRTH